MGGEVEVKKGLPMPETEDTKQTNSRLCTDMGHGLELLKRSRVPVELVGGSRRESKFL